MPLYKFNLEEMFQKQFGYKPLDIPIDQNNLHKKSEPGKYGSYNAEDLQGRTVLYACHAWCVSGFVQTPCMRQYCVSPCISR